MTVFAAALALSGPNTIRAKLRRLDAAYARLDPYPIEAPADHLREILEGYRDVVEEVGPITRAEAGVGRCLFLFGRYGDAAKAFALAGEGYKAKLNESRTYAAVADAIGRQSKPLAVRQLRHLPNTDQWVALLGYEPGESGWQADAPCKLVVYRRSPGGERLHQIGKSKELGGFWAGFFSTLYPVRLSAGDRSWHILFFRRGSGDCAPFDVRVFAVGHAGLKTIQTFDVTEGASVRGPSAGHGLLAWVGPAWHLKWADVYEWTGKRFSLANRRFPSFFTVDRASRSSYTSWMNRAAELDIKGRYGAAELAWKQARRACRYTLQHTDPDDVDYETRKYGDLQENLKEIDQRLGWLAHAQYDHALLYRPIDCDLQVPPYKLGKANDDR